MNACHIGKLPTRKKRARCQFHREECYYPFNRLVAEKNWVSSPVLG
ncbi:hypothetical protein [Moorena sp. SIO3I6]|nr:hypothetical protein [Moorena sp. SIO3I6]NEP25993.1 hypothetical protein [Moorena sp. SIO3I6]